MFRSESVQQSLHQMVMRFCMLVEHLIGEDPGTQVYIYLCRLVWWNRRDLWYWNSWYGRGYGISNEDVLKAWSAPIEACDYDRS